MKRTSSSRVNGLISQASPLHTGVTLFQLDESAEASSSSPRRSKRVKLDETVTSTILDLEETVSFKMELAPPGPSKKVGASTPGKSPRKVKPIQQSLEKPHPTPLRWREAYDAIKEMRKDMVAPVDTQGCDRAQLKETEPKNQRFATLVSLMLSSQTKDEVTDAAVTKLREAVGGSLSVDAAIAANEVTVAEAINKVGFWRRKTQYIKQTAQRLRDDFESDVPKTVDELCSLPGVGPKMAFLALQVAWKLNHGIGVDVHVHRITNRLGWHKPATKMPEETRLNLQSWLPIELHPEINHMLVGFGQMICLPVGTRCDKCTLSAAGLCPSARVVSPKKRKSTVKLSPGPKIEITLETMDVKEEPDMLDKLPVIVPILKEEDN